MRWDIFCQIVDNYGDAGVCWRLAKSLTSIHKQEVRLYCDDLPTMHLLVAGYFTGTANNPDPQIEILPWEASFDNARHTVLPPDVVIEAFGCNPPNRYLSTLLSAPRLPLLMNLEYLSAERWVGDYHAKPSPQSHGLPKVFFFPGFDTDTGGLLIDPVVPEGVTTKDAIPASLSPTWSHLRPHARRISVFCYPDDRKSRRGKLRILYEAHPLAFIVEQAGGSATDGNRRILDIVPDELHARVPLILGNTREVELYRELWLREHATEAANADARA